MVQVDDVLNYIAQSPTVMQVVPKTKQNKCFVSCNMLEKRGSDGRKNIKNINLETGWSVVRRQWPANCSRRFLSETDREKYRRTPFCLSGDPAS